MIDISNTSAQRIMSHIYSGYDSHLSHEDSELKSNVSKITNYSFSKNGVDFIGSIPYYTLWNLGKSRDRVLDIDEDCIIGIVGKPGTGKSTLSFVGSLFTDPLSFDNSRIIFTFEELLKFLKICAEEIMKEEKNTKYRSFLRGVPIVVDEGVFMLFSADANTKEGRLATKLFTVIRFLNIMMFINITNYEKLNKTIRESRIYSVIRLVKKGKLEYYSKKRTGKIQVTPENEVIYPEPNFIEDVGYISKECDFWSSYNPRKAGFVLDSINSILEEIENVTKKR